MIDAILMLIVPGAVLLALLITAAAVLGWMMRRAQR
jgi:hypothetical protein